MNTLIRKTASVIASASFIGASLMGAVAQDMNSYPHPFVQNGQFNGNIVVGSSAASEDIVGSVDLASSLQFALKTPASIESNQSTVIPVSGFKIQRTGNRLNLGESASDILGSSLLSNDELPMILSDGKYAESEGNNKNSVTYTQKLSFNNVDTLKLNYAQDDDLVPTASDRVLINKNDNLYNYDLDFDSAVQYDYSDNQNLLNDFKTTTLNIQGKTYTITDAEKYSDGRISKLSLLAGESVLWLTQNQPITKTINGVQHTIEVQDVTDQANACQVKVDDVTAIIDVDNTKTINGVDIGISDVRAIHAQLQDTDICQLSIGASSLEIRDGDTLKLDDTSLDGSSATIDSTPGELNGIHIKYSPEDTDDDIYLAKGDSYTDPVFKSWKALYGGLNGKSEQYSFKTNGDKKATFSFKNNDNRNIDVPVFYDKNTILVFGNDIDADSRLYSSNFAGATSTMPDTCTAATVQDCEGMEILASTPNGEGHIFKVSHINPDKNETNIYDQTYGRTFDNIQYTDGVNSTLSLGSFGTIDLNINSATNSVAVVDSIKSKIETHNGGSLMFTDNNPGNSSVSVEFSEQNRNGENIVPDEMQPSLVTLTAQPNAGDDRIEIMSSVNGNNTVTVSKNKDSNSQLDVTPVGTIVTTDTDNRQSVTVDFPSSEVFGDLYITPVNSEIQHNEYSGNSYNINRLNVGVAKLDNEIGDIASQNLIIVGGPASNKIAASVLGLNYPSYGADSGITPDTAIIKSVAQQNGHVVILVAGYNAADTRRATRVLANFEQYNINLSPGSKYVVTGPDLTNIMVVKSS